MTIALPLAIGLAIFLAGMKVMELAMHCLAGPYLHSALERFTRTPLRGMLTGTGLTALLQSSSAITVITIGLVNTGLMSFPRTLGIILGTNIGTCLTTELIGLNMNHYAVNALIVSAAVWLASWIVPDRENAKFALLTRWLKSARYLALAVCGFSCILIGIEIMQTITPALQSRGLFAWFVEESKKSLLWGMVAGACLTAVIQSSAATIAITMGLASVQAISVELGIAITIGANIGTCATAFMAAIGGTKYGQLVAWAHIILNIGGALLFYPLLWVLYEASVMLSSTASGQIAHAQTIFNIATSLLALPICYLRVFRKVKTS
jgi:phosphate:Na+ symporter